MAKHPKHLFVNTPAFAASLAQLQDPAAHPYVRQQAAEQVYTGCHAYVVQQGGVFASAAEELGIDRKDLEQTAALKLWEFVNRVSEGGAVDPKAFVRQAQNVVRTEMRSLCEQGSGDVCVAAITSSQEATYAFNARKPALRLHEVMPTADMRVNAVDEDAQMDGVFDAPAQGAAELMRAPQLLPEDELEARRQRDVVVGYAREKLPARYFDVLSRRFGLEDGRNECETQQHIADAEGITKERVKQIESESINRLRAHLGANGRDMKKLTEIMLRNV